MKSLMLALALGAALASPCAVQAAGSAPRGIPGTLDPATGVFTPLVVKQPAASSTTVSGTILITITLSALDSAISPDAQVTCSASIGTYDTSFSNSAAAEAGLVRSGKGGTCTLTIPYTWTVASTADMVNVSFEVTTGSGYTVDSTSHSTSHSFTPFKLPANGATTKLSLTDSL